MRRRAWMLVRTVYLYPELRGGAEGRAWALGRCRSERRQKKYPGAGRSGCQRQAQGETGRCSNKGNWEKRMSKRTWTTRARKGMALKEDRIGTCHRKQVCSALRLAKKKSRGSGRWTRNDLLWSSEMQSVERMAEGLCMEFRHGDASIPDAHEMKREKGNNR